MKIKNEKEALMMFCEQENQIREIFINPFSNENDGGNIWATDGRVLLIVDKELTRCKYQALTLRKPEVCTDNIDRQISFAEIDKAYKKFKLVDEMQTESGEGIECEECDGDGTVEYEYYARNGRTYHYEHTCPVCLGRGTVKESLLIPTGRKVLPKATFYVFGEATFNASVIMRAVEGLRKMGFDSMTHKASIKVGANRFQICDGVELLIMASSYMNEKEKPQKVKVY